MSAITEAAVTAKMGQITVTPVTDPPNQIPSHRRYCVCQLGGVIQPDGTRTPLLSGVWDRWTDTVVARCPGGNPEAKRIADRLNGRERAGFDVDLAEMMGVVTR